MAFETTRDVFANREGLSRKEAVRANLVFRGVNATVTAKRYDDDRRRRE